MDKQKVVFFRTKEEAIKSREPKFVPNTKTSILGKQRYSYFDNFITNEQRQKLARLFKNYR